MIQEMGPVRRTTSWNERAYGDAYSTVDAGLGRRHTSAGGDPSRTFGLRRKGEGEGTERRGGGIFQCAAEDASEARPGSVCSTRKPGCCEGSIVQSRLGSVTKRSAAKGCCLVHGVEGI